jgi:hypothetical protein
MSLFTQVTVLPGGTVMLGGLKAKFWMLTVTLWGCCCAPVEGTNISRAMTESVAKYDSRLIDFLLAPSSFLDVTAYTNRTANRLGDKSR